jgi:hypothetical protein
MESILVPRGYLVKSAIFLSRKLSFFILFYIILKKTIC